jgi:ribosomal protein S18 acetylase RimI-like enzyme
MKIELTDSPKAEDADFVVTQTRTFNAAFMPNDVKDLCVIVRDVNDNIIGGLTGKTYWNYFDIAFLWIHEEHRGAGLATALMKTAENEARRRGCLNIQLDTFSFQALGFYKKLGYKEFGSLSGYTGNHNRHYLYKYLGNDLHTKSQHHDI